MRIALVYSSRYGQTRKISEVIADTLRELSQGRNQVDLFEVDRLPKKNSFPEADLYVIGSPVYAQGFPARLRRWTRKNAAALAKRDVALFMVSMNAADTRERAKREDLRLQKQLISQTGLSPSFIGSFAGALRYTQYIWPLRLIMRSISARAGGPVKTDQDFEMTDWEKVARFAKAIDTNDRKSEFAPARAFSAESTGLFAPA